MDTLANRLAEARTALSSGRPDLAEPVYRHLLDTAPEVADLWHEHGIAQLQLGRAEQARASLERAAELDPANPYYLSNLGVALRQLKHFTQAADCFRRAIGAGGPAAQLYSNLALALKENGQLHDSLAAFDEGLRHDPGFAGAHFNRANLLLELDRIEEAESGYRRAIELDPSDAGAYCQLGIAQLGMAQPESALASFARALELKPDYAEARRNRAMAWLSQHDYERGWPEFEYRLQCEGFVPRVNVGQRWRGEPLAGRTLLVHAEQGLGDTLQFVRYLPLLEQFGGRILLEVQPPLVPLLRAAGYDRWLIDGPGRPAFDLQCPLMSLAGYVPQPGGRPYWREPYLAASSDLVAAWKPRIDAMAGFRVGIAWSGNPEHSLNSKRSAPLAAFAPLAAVPGVRLVSLQKGPAAGELDQLQGQFDVAELVPPLDETTGAFMDTAAVMQHLDLVISVDTSIVHLAGGLGVECWVPLPFSPDWRWSFAGERTAWYPSLCLYRQTQRGVWSGVFNQMAATLNRRAGG